jgi:hypothetical protein
VDVWGGVTLALRTSIVHIDKAGQTKFKVKKDELNCRICFAIDEINKPERMN